MSDWIKWMGGDCPAGDPLVEVRLRNGDEGNGFATEFCWRHCPESADLDIMAYRLTSTTEPKEKAK